MPRLTQRTAFAVSLLAAALWAAPAPAQGPAQDPAQQPADAPQPAESDEGEEAAEQVVDEAEETAESDEEADEANEAQPAARPAPAGPRAAPQPDAEQPTRTIIKPTAVVEATVVETEANDDAVEVSGGDTGGVYVSGNVRQDDTEEFAALGWEVEVFGYIRTQYTQITDDPNQEAFGRNDGFTLANARFGLFGILPSGLGFELELDGAVDRRGTDVNDPNAEVVTRLKDAYLFYMPIDQLSFSAGQFKPPFDLEELTSTSEILFIERSVGARGVRGPEGFNVEGLSQSRQVGARLTLEPWFPMAGDADEDEGFGVAASAAVTNGQDANRSLNDNDELAYYGRLTLHWSDIVQVGGAAYYNERTVGTQPDLIGESEFGWTADLLFDAYGATLTGGIIQTETDPEIEAASAITATAYYGAVAYELPWFGLQPAYRYAFYDPTSEVDTATPSLLTDSDELTYHTIGLNYNAKTYPVRVAVNYTLTQEAEARELDNDRFDALLQLEW